MRLGDGMSLEGGGLDLRFGGYDHLCTCCYIGIYSYFNSPVDFSFPEQNDLSKLSWNIINDFLVLVRLKGLEFKTNPTK